MDRLIEEAICEAWLFDQWTYENETAFKYELFYRLGRKVYKNQCLGKKSDNELTCHVHSEAKAQNQLKGNKADIVICDPSELDNFNYNVKHVLELKLKLSESELKKEKNKIDIYSKEFKSYWIVGGLFIKNKIKNCNLQHKNALNLYIRTPECKLNKLNSAIYEPIKLDQAYNIVTRCIKDVLNMYGAGKQQFNSFFWCNYEDEISRGHSFPSEGDFNAQLYSKLRDELPTSIVIYSEYKVEERRIDLVIADRNTKWAVPIEVKMNWEQFKRKYDGNHNIQQSEASLIISRFKLIEKKFIKTKPILIVIQGEWRINNKNKTVGNDNKSYAVEELEKHKNYFSFFCYNETLDKVTYNW